MKKLLLIVVDYQNDFIPAAWGPDGGSKLTNITKDTRLSCSGKRHSFYNGYA